MLHVRKAAVYRNAGELSKRPPHPRKGERIVVRGFTPSFQTPLILTFSPQGEKEFFIHLYWLFIRACL
jgi:hypothetical protein